MKTNVSGVKSGRSVVAALFLATIGCVSATISEPSACDSKSVSWAIPTLPNVVSSLPCQQVSATLPSMSTTTKFDLSDPVKKVSDIADSLRVAINQLTIDNPNSDFSWVKEVDVMVSRDTVSGDTPVKLASYTLPASGASNELNVGVVMPADTVLQYLKSGSLTLTVSFPSSTVDGCTVAKLATKSGSLTGTVHMCVSASGDVNKTF